MGVQPAHRQDRHRQRPRPGARPLQPLGHRIRGDRAMSPTSKRSAASSELRDWKVWAIAAGAAVALVHAVLQRMGWWAVLLLPPVLAAVAAGVWVWLRRRPSGFAAEATRALAAHLPDGGRPPRVVRSQSDGHAHEIEWRLRDRKAGPALLKKASDLEHELGAALQLRLNRDRLRLRAGTAEIPDLVTYQDFYRHHEPAGELVVGIGESRWGPVWADLVRLPHVLIGGTTNF